MTTETDLLPLYAELQGHPKIEIIKHYARACVSSATASKDAAAEVLRKELEFQAALTKELLPYQERAVKAEAHAERLAEALREAYRQVRELCDCYGHVYPEASFVRYEALLRNQEDRNG